MSDALREQAAARFRQYAEASVRRLSLDIEREQVTLWLRGDALRDSCTCGVHECGHVLAALHFLAGGAALPWPTEPRARPSSRPPEASDELGALATAFEDLCLATVRAGMATAESPSIKSALSELLKAAPEPVPLPIARWVGRLRESLATGDTCQAAHLFDGALQWAERLRVGDTSPAAMAQSRAWLGTAGDGAGSESLADVTLVEVAREWVTGTERAEIEHRYLVELGAGTLLVEQRRRGEVDASVGPCPRIALVAFAELAAAGRPPRVRLLQYTLSVQLGEAALSRLLELAETQVAALRQRYVQELRDAPALAEPVVLFAPALLEEGPRGALRDADGEQLEFAEPEVLGADAVRAALRGAELACVCGRLLGREAGLVLRPLSVLARRGAWLELQRIT